MTERIFDEQPGLGVLDTAVLACTPAETGWDLRLKSTICYPRGGGQPCEGGRIGDAAILDVYYDETGDILHRVDRALEPGPVRVEIDLQKRRELQQQHSAQHLLSAAMHRLFGVDTVIARMEEPDAHIELPRPLTPAQLQAVLQEARRVIDLDIPVRCFYTSPAEAEALRPRGRITPHARIRLVQMGDYDLNACGGTHVDTTGQIGEVRFTGMKTVRGLFRVYYRAGVRVTDHDRQAEAALLRLQSLTEAQFPEEAADRLEHQAAEVQRLTAREQSMKEQLAQFQRMALEAALVAGRGAAALVLPDCDLKELRPLCAQLVKERPGVLLLVTRAQAPAILLIRSKESGPDLGAKLRQVLAIFPGKGGGNPVLAQATLEPGADPDAVLEALKA